METEVGAAHRRFGGTSGRLYRALCQNLLSRVFAIAKTRNNDTNEISSVPGFDDLVIQWGEDNESNIKESKPDTEPAL